MEKKGEIIISLICQDSLYCKFPTLVSKRKKRILGMLKNRRAMHSNAGFLTFIIIVFTLTFFLGARVIATSSGNSDNANLTIYDDIDRLAENRYSNMNITFYANFTNSTWKTINSSSGAGYCQIQFNLTGEYGTYTNATYNITSFLWTYNRSFNRKGDSYFRFNCISNFGNVSVLDNFTITNTAPSISLDQGENFIDLDGNKLNTDYWLCNEDTLCIYNFSANITDVDTNDILTYSNLTQNTTLGDFNLNSATGILQINVTLNENTGLKTIRLQVEDSDGAQKSSILKVNISAVNDAPTFISLANQTFNMSRLFEYIIIASDQENNIPFTFNITFLSCVTMQWSYRNNTDCNLFNSSQYTANSTAINISFTPSRNDVGDYIINFTVRDLNNNVTPYNASTSRIINFSVMNVNVVPYFIYICDNARNTTENATFNCYINATDIDETSKLIFSSNVSWFLDSQNATVNTTTNFNGSILINFTTSDINVGNWSINLTVRDTGSPVGQNSSIFWFFVDNVNDSVDLGAILNIDAYTSNNYTFYINATDDDLLIKDKNIFNETLTFFSNTSWVHISTYQVVADSNRTVANMSFNPNDASPGIHAINITVVDRGNFSIDSIVFNITISGNNPPVWSNLTAVEVLYENTGFYRNYTKNVTDADNNSLIFSYSSDSVFSSFSINANTGIVDFTPTDEDVGLHWITITASDSISTSSQLFNYTVYNVNDAPIFETPITATNASVDVNSNVGAIEDNYTTIEFFVRDDDFKILSGQKGFYNESLLLNVTIQGPNPSLFNFTRDAAFPTPSGISANRSHYSAIFIPNKTDIGSYNITLNITDRSNSSIIWYFNLSISGINHAPDLLGVNNVTYSILETIYLDFNVSDEEEKNESFSGSNLTFRIINLTAGGNFLTINSSTGVINFTLNATYAGTWNFNISVNDSSGAIDSEIFTLKVYDYPVILFPSTGFNFSFVENTSSVLNFSINHTIGDNLNYSFYINRVLKNNTLNSGNGTYFLFYYTPNFTEETCGGTVNLTLNASNPKLQNSTSWNLVINHTNSPTNFLGTIGGSSQTISGISSVSVTLSDYFSDVDAADICHNQTIGFGYSLIGAISSHIFVSIVNWTNRVTPTVTFSSSVDASNDFSITAYEFNESNSSHILRNITSNNFTVNLSIVTTTVTAPSTGGGGATVVKPISLKIIVPAPIFANFGDKLKVNISFINDGQKDLENIKLSDYVSKNSSLTSSIITTLNISEISILKVGARVDASMFIEVNANETGRYDVLVNGTVKNPVYSNWEKFYIHIEEQQIKIQEKIFFTEELLAKNPECAEIRDLLKEAEELFNMNKLSEANKKLDEAVDGCKRAISQPPNLSPKNKDSFTNNIFNYLSIATLIAIILGALFYIFGRVIFKRITKTIIRSESPSDEFLKGL